MQIIWAARLGLFLFRRVLSHEDVRFRQAKQNPLQFLLFWEVQGVWCFLTHLPVFLSTFYGTRDSINPIGAVLFLVGQFVESVADFQKFQVSYKRLIY
jgi:steroid 5-alpha reductase family enzyme